MRVVMNLSLRSDFEILYVELILRVGLVLGKLIRFIDITICSLFEMPLDW